MVMYLGIKLVIFDKPFALIYSTFSLYFRTILIELAVYTKQTKNAKSFMPRLCVESYTHDCTDCIMDKIFEKFRNSKIHYQLQNLVKLQSWL